MENPSVIALAADVLGAGAVPIVCTNGQPRAAAMVLLRSLAAAGVRLRHHGDFDWGGLTIGNLLHRRLPIEPWQFDRDAYLRAVGTHPHAAPLSGSPVEASWDPRLAEAMLDAGRQIEEELVADDLLETFELSWPRCRVALRSATSHCQFSIKCVKKKARFARAGLRSCRMAPMARRLDDRSVKRVWDSMLSPWS